MTEIDRGLSRRKFLKAAGGLAGAVALAGLGACAPTPEQVAAPKFTEEPLTPKQYEGTTLFFNKDGLPVKCKTVDGQEMSFDKTKVQAAKEKAVQQKEAEVAAVVGVTVSQENADVKVGSERYPRTLEKPDVLTDDELQQRGVTIIQPDSTKLYLRKNAFETGPFSQFDGTRQLTVALIDSPLLLQQYVTDPKYDGIRDIIKDRLYETYIELPDGQRAASITDDQLAELKKLEIQKKRDLVESNRNAIQTYQENPLVTKQQLEESLLMSKAELRAYEDGVCTDEDILMSQVGGKYWRGLYVENHNGSGKNVIFVAVGQRDKRNLVSIYFDEKGDVHTSTYQDTVLSQHTARGVRPEQTHPMSHQGESYPGWILRHELKHDETRNDAGLTIDEDAMNQMVSEDYGRAEQKWQDSSFGKEDQQGDSLYSIAWEVPANAGGGYIKT